MLTRRDTKILATLGPATAEPAHIRALIQAGADGVRINMSHLPTAELGAWVRRAREAAAAERAPLAVVVDLAGPKLRVGALPGGTIRLEPGVDLVLGRDLPVTLSGVLAGVQPGQRILLDDGRLELEAGAACDGGLRARVRVGGELLAGKGVNLPDTDLDLPALTDKDRADLEAAVAACADYVSLSFIQRPDDVRAARRALPPAGPAPALIAKIEKPAAVERFEDILAVSDGIMIARGDLGVEVPPERVPVLQKRFIQRANAEGKTIVTATQMLESMMRAPRPTRAEASDVANAVWDGTDAAMLSGETAVGRYPVESVRMMRAIIAEAERAAAPRRDAPRGGTRVHALAAAAVEAAERLRAAAIVVITVSGYTAQMVARHRPTAPLIAAVPDERVAGCLALVWGVTPLVIPWRGASPELIDGLESALRPLGVAAPGRPVILISGSTKVRGADFILKILEPGA